MQSPFARKKVQYQAQMNVVPYIDVMLVLLVIFMAATPMLATGVDVSLPKATTQAILPNKTPVIVSLNKDGLFVTTDGKPIPTDKKHLADVIAPKLAQNQELTVMIRADKSMIYDDVISLMAHIQSIGVKKVGLITEPTP